MMEQPQAKKNEILGQVIEFCHAHLGDDRAVYNYLTKIRGLSDSTIIKFKLGAFPSNIFRLMKFIDPWELQQSGIIRYVDGQEYSKFIYNNVIIPIFDAHGRPTAIIGRTLLPEAAQKALNINKYDNTRFHKSSCLFGLNVAKDSIRELDSAIIVEGNLDVITAHQTGNNNVVGISGSFFTKKQMSLVGRYTSNIGIMLDNDESGRKATKAVFSKPPPDGLTFREIKFPECYKDPDEYFRRA